VREKDQRSMEMIITSLSPRELVTGKVLGMTLLSLTQVAVWALGAGAAIGLAMLGVLEPQALSIPWRALLWGALLGVPGYFLYAVIAAGLMARLFHAQTLLSGESLSLRRFWAALTQG